MTRSQAFAGANQLPARRWVRYSLRTLLVVITGFCLLSAFVGHQWRRVQRQREAIAAIGAQNIAYYGCPDYGLGMRGPIGLQPGMEPQKPPSFSWLHRFLGEEWTADVVWARVRDDDQLNWLGAFPALRWLDLDEARITPDALSVLRNLPNIEGIYLSYTDVNDEGLKHLQSLNKLRFLTLADPAENSDEGLKNLAKLSQLEWLDLNLSRIDGSGLAYLKDLHRLKHLDLGTTHIEDEHLEHLLALTALEDLGLEFTAMNDAGITRLSQLPHLRQLRVAGTQVTPACAARLAKGLPNLIISFDRGGQMDREGNPIW